MQFCKSWRGAAHPPPPIHPSLRPWLRRPYDSASNHIGDVHVIGVNSASLGHLDVTACMVACISGIYFYAANVTSIRYRHSDCIAVFQHISMTCLKKNWMLSFMLIQVPTSTWRTCRLARESFRTCTWKRYRYSELHALDFVFFLSLG